MDIIFMKTNNDFTNDSDFVQSDFIAQNPGISIPYLILISISTVTGCIGNAMVIGSVATYKVLINLFIKQFKLCRKYGRSNSKVWTQVYVQFKLQCKNFYMIAWEPIVFFSILVLKLGEFI